MMKNEVMPRELKIVMYMVLAVLVSGFFACTEIKYRLWGKTVDAKILSIGEGNGNGRRGRERPVVKIKYQILDEKMPEGYRNEGDHRPIGWTYPADAETIPVEYIPGKVFASRLKETASNGPFYVFLGSVLLWVVAIVWYSVHHDPKRNAAQARAKSRSKPR